MPTLVKQTGLKSRPILTHHEHLKREHSSDGHAEDPTYEHHNVYILLGLDEPWSSKAYRESHVETSDTSVPQEETEELMVQKPDTVAYPGTMVVHPHDALVADAAVVRSRWLYNLAPLAVLIL